MKIGVYPGSFDPITNGHLDIIKRSYQLFDKLYVVIPNNMNKKFMFTVTERVNMIKEVLKDYPNIIVTSTDELTVKFAEEVGADCMVRGLRMVSDFEYELQLATINKQLDPKLETIFIMSNHEYSYLSSSMVKEIASFGEDVSAFVPKIVEDAIKNKINK